MNKHRNSISVPAWNTPPAQLVPLTAENFVYDNVGHFMASVAYLTDYHSLEWDSPTQDALLLKEVSIILVDLKIMQDERL